MIFQSFLLGNLVSLCMKIINSVVVVGLYYGFLTTFSIGPSYLFLLRAQVMEEGTEKKVSATTGFITGQLMMLISIYYAPLHLALGRPHTITVLALPYLLFHFFWNNHKHFFDYGSTNRNLMRNLSIQCVFLNNLIFQLFNYFILPSSMLARLVNIYMFRCNNKMLFLTSSFVGWLIGHILFMKWLGLVLVWIQQNHSIRSNVLIRSNKYLVSELRNFMDRIFSILLFITCIYYLGRMPSPILTKKLKETSQAEEGVESEEERDVDDESEITPEKSEEDSSSLFSEEKENPYKYKMDETEEIRVKGKEKTKNEFHFQFTETGYNNNPFYDYEDSYLTMNGNQENSKLKEKNAAETKELFHFEKPLVTILFDYKRWNRPFRYIKNNRFNKAVRKEISQYFFETCKNDGKQRISFTYLPSLSTFWEMIQNKLSLSPLDKTSSNEFDKQWVYTNNKKQNNLNKEFRNRIEAIDKEFLFLNILDIKTRFCNDDTNSNSKYLPKMYDPLLKGAYRGRIKEMFLPSKTSIENLITTVGINRIHSILTNYQEFEQKRGLFNKKKFSTEIYKLLTLDVDDESEKESSGLKKISKKLSRWSYNLITDLEQQSGEFQENAPFDHQIRSRKAKRVVIFTANKETTNSNPADNNTANEAALMRYSQQSDFRRGLIKGSIRAQRRKLIIWELFQANVHSPLFLDRIKKSPLFSFDIDRFLPNFEKDKNDDEFEILESIEEETKEDKIEKEKKEENKKKEQARIEIAEAWDTIPFAQVIRGCMLITQSVLRKYIFLPFYIIVKNVGRMLLFQFPEWSEDIQAWNREMHIKCTYNGVQLSETEFPKNWLTDGIQIKILFPFCLKPWRRSKRQFSNRYLKKKEKASFYFLTVWGMETNLPFGSPRKGSSLFDFFEPVIRELEIKLVKCKRVYFLALKVLKEKTKLFLIIAKETKRWFVENFLFLKRRIKELWKVNQIRLLGLRNVKVYDLNESTTEKDSIIISNEIIHESVSQIKFAHWTNSSLTEKKKKNMTDRTSTIINQIEQITKTITPGIHSSPTKISYNTQRFQFSKSFLKIVKKRNDRLIFKFDSFIKIFLEKIYIKILLFIINIPKLNTQSFAESKKKSRDIAINETNYERINKKNHNKISFISTIKKSIANINKKKNSHLFSDLSYLSQAYVFYKLSQTQAINLYKLRYVFHDRETHFFLKTEIKNFFERKGLIHSKLSRNKLTNCGMDQWKGWLKEHYQYDLSPTRWSKLRSAKWRKRVKQHNIIQNQTCKSNFYEKDQLIDSKKQKDSEVSLLFLLNQKENFQKNSRYDLLSYQYINSENRGNSFFYESPFERKETINREFFANSNTYKHNPFDRLENTTRDYYLGKGAIRYRKNYYDRKYFNWKILNLDLRKSVDMDIQAWVKSNTRNNQNNKIGSNHKLSNKNKKGHFYRTLLKNPKRNSRSPKKVFLDWMGMNEEILNRPSFSLGLELWFFPEFLLLYNLYKREPWVIPSKVFICNLNLNENVENVVSEKKNITGKEKGEFISSNKNTKKKKLNQKEPATRRKDLGAGVQKSQGTVETFLSTKQENQIQEDYEVSKIKKGKKKKHYKQYKSKTEAELNLFLKRHFLFQLRWGDALNQRIMNNIKIYCLLLRLKNPKKITISSIQRREMSLDIMLIQKNLSLPELIKRGVLVIEPNRLSVKNDGKFLMYKTLGISLVHTQTNQRYQEEEYVDTNHFNLLVPENILSPRRRREFRILICFNSKSKNKNLVDIPSLCWTKNNCKQLLDKEKDLDKDKNELINLKLFLWPNYRLEDLACLNRYWFDTTNGSRFSILRIHMYPWVKSN
ncbi:Ycf1 protein (plastid) [Oldenlandia corymbosa var. corymbosa]|uniref:Protein TIC 214 n=1 Tax=Oldenlandia corymbosa var. corymbosa TaxID=529605 RepID=A0AAV1EHL4_OLDCO|nr:Ycf1 protein [Oldenlandia corymbosa var. corymbosa]